MKKLKTLKNYSSFGIAFFLLMTSMKFNNSFYKPFIVIQKQNEAWNLNSNMLLNYNLGFKRLISSFLWVSTILESDIEHYKQRDLNSWMFLRFNTISLLEPRFYENYSFGGIYLSIIKDDLDGASIIYNKGLSLYPSDLHLLKDASFHFFYEARDFDRAFQITQAFKRLYPASISMLGMITKLEAEKGSLTSALETLNEYQKSYLPGTLVGDKIFQNRYALRAEIDLNCLNHQEENKCSLIDLNNRPYIKTNLSYRAQNEWKPYRRKSLKLK
jgi:hypothetical protein